MCPDEAEPTHFLNVDFDLESDRSIADLTVALGRKVIILCQTDRLVSFELFSDHKSIETCLTKFACAINDLPPNARRIWDGCTRRTANVGIQAGFRPHSIEFSISHLTIGALTEIGCDLTFTVYAPLAQPVPSSAAGSS